MTTEPLAARLAEVAALTAFEAAIKVALETIPPFAMGGLRYVIGGLILALMLRARGVRLPEIAA